MTCLAGAVLTVVPGAVPAAAAGAATTRAPHLAIFYRSPVLVRPGETVRIPVDVVCTASGKPCDSVVRLTLGGGARSASAPASPGLSFDLTQPASRVRSGGRLDFVLSAGALAPGRALRTGSTALPGTNGGSLHLYVASRMRRTALPAVAPGSYREGKQVAFLPWGSGQSSAGLSAGEEAATLGPSSFAIGPDGTIEVADVFHQRILEFRAGRLIAALDLAMSPQTDLAVGSDGDTFVASDFAAAERKTRYTVLDVGGDLESFRTVPGDILGGIGTDGTTGYAHVLPLDAWTAFPAAAGAPPGPPDTGLPLANGGMLLRSVVGNSVRLGIASGDHVTGAVELRSASTLGDLAFAAPDGSGGYVAVVRVAGDAGDQYEVAHIARDASVDAFAVPSRQFAQPMPQAQFRLGPDGALYQMTTSPDGVRIVRYGMGGTR
jgi:hypothetical protein